MKLLLKRNQTASAFGRLGRPTFKLRAQFDLENDEYLLIDKYKFGDSLLVAAVQPGMLWKAFFFGFVCFVVGGAVASGFLGSITSGYIAGGLLGAFGTWFFYDRKRETIYVRDLIHGRYFDCKSIIDLARKEHYLQHICGYLRQVLESAKHWDGTETVQIDPMTKGEAKLFMIRGL